MDLSLFWMTEGAEQAFLTLDIEVHFSPIWTAIVSHGDIYEKKKNFVARL